MRLLKIVPGLILLLALPAVAEEIVYFKNGQSMPVVSTELIDGMVHIDMGDNALMAFPEASIERIEVAGKEVNLKASDRGGVNRRVTSPAGSYSAETSRPPRERELIKVDNSRPSPIETDKETGLAGYRPQGNHPAKNRRHMVANGNMRVFANNPTVKGNGQTFAGTTQVGDRHVIGSVRPRRRATGTNPNTPEAVSIGLNDDVNSGAPERRPAAPKDKGQPQQDGSDNN